MTQKVKIRKGEKIILVHFMWNDDLVDKMREHNGWWNNKERAWQFPLYKFEQIYDDLTKSLYRVEILKL